MQLERKIGQAPLAYPFEWELIVDTYLLHTDEVTLGATFRRIVISIVCLAQVGILLVGTPIGYHGHVGYLLVASLGPAVDKLAGHGVEVAIRAVEHWVEANHVAKRIGHKYIECKVLVLEGIVQTSVDRRVGRSFIHEVAFLYLFLEVDVAGCQFAVLIDKSWIAILVESLKVEREQRAHGISLQGEAIARYHRDNRRVRLQVCHLVASIREDKVGIPAKVLQLDVDC